MENGTVNSMAAWLAAMMTGAGDGGRSGGGGGGGGNGSEGGYQVAKFDFAHISTPYVICMWILLASAMKVGYHHLHMYKVQKLSSSLRWLYKCK